jgi:putative ABC transport system permease protein
MNLYNLKIALLNLKSKSLITIGSLLSLVFGGICIVLLLSYVDNELSMNKFHEREKDIYLCISKITPQSDWHPIDPGTFLNNDYSEYPEVECFTHIGRFKEGEFSIRSDKKIFTPEGIFADSSFFKVFDFELLNGSQNALSKSNSILISSRLAIKLFGHTDVIGESLSTTYRFDQSLQIAGILSDPKSDSSLQFDFIVPHRNEYQKMGVDFLLLKKGSNISNFKNKFSNIGTDHPQFKEGVFSILPLVDVYFTASPANFKSYFSKFGSKKSVYILLSCIVFLFAISFLNLTNLQILGINASRTSLGIHKVNGAKLRHLLAHFSTEILIISTLALLIISLGVFMLLPYFNMLIESDLNLDRWDVLLITLAYTATLTCMAFVYPLLIIKKQTQNHIIRDLRSLGQKKLVVVQFIVLVFFLISSMVSTKQIDFLLAKDLGFSSNHIIQVKMFDELNFTDEKEVYMEKLANRKDNLKQIKDLLQADPNIISYSQGDSPLSPLPFPWKADVENQEYSTQNMLIVNPGHAKLFDFQVLSGRFFDEKLDQSREYKVVLNEAALQYWNISDIKNTILKNRYWHEADFEIIGTIKDFNYEHLSTKPKPLVLLYFYDFKNDFFIQLNHKNIREGIRAVEQLFYQFNPDKTFEYAFVSEQIQQMYASEKRLRLIYIIFTIVSVIIACMGLFTVALFDTKKKTKEIGLRKVNGAKSFEIMQLLNQDFLKLVCIALVIAFPISYYAMDKWLQNFAYKIELSWWIFALAGIIALGIALLTVSWQSWRAARRNPVDSLRYE